MLATVVTYQVNRLSEKLLAQRQITLSRNSRLGARASQSIATVSEMMVKRNIALPELSTRTSVSNGFH